MHEFYKNRGKGTRLLSSFVGKFRNNRVLFFNDRMFDLTMGGEKSVQDRARMLSLAGFDVTIIFQLDRECVKQPYLKDKYGVKYQKETGFGRNYIGLLEKTIPQHNPSIVFLGRTFMSSWFKACIDQDHIFSIGVFEYWALFVSNAQKFHEGDYTLIEENLSSLRRLDCVMCNSDFTAAWVRKQGVESVIVAEPLIDVHHLEGFGKRAGVHKEKYAVLVVGIVKHWKLLFDIIKHAPENYQFIIATYDMPPNLNVRKYLSQDITIIESYAAPMEEIYKIADVLIHPTFLSETYGKVVLEAMLHNVAVVASDRGNMINTVLRTVPYEAHHDVWLSEIDSALKIDQTELDTAKKIAKIKSHNKPETGLNRILHLLEKREQMRTECISANFPGVLTAMKNLANFMGFNVVDDWDGNSELILGGWTQVYQKYLDRGAVPWIYFCSNIAQIDSDITNSEITIILYLVNLYKQGKIKGLLMTSEQDSVHIRDMLGIKTVYVPAVMDMKEYASVQCLKQVPGYNVGLFFAPHHRKNLLVQMSACKITESNVHVSIAWHNSKGYAESLTVFTGAHVFHHNVPFDRRDAWLMAIKSMDVLLGVTLCETFGYTVAEACALGVPVIYSEAVACMKNAPRVIESLCKVKDVTDVNEIAHAICLLRYDDIIRKDVIQAARDWIKYVAIRNQQIARENLLENGL